MDTWTWYERSGVWAFRFQIDIGDRQNNLFPQITEWYALVSDRYPLGRIRVMPACQNGLIGTFYHQRLNKPLSDLPWTAGEICTDEPGYLLDRLVYIPEPRSSADRLCWHINKAKEWIKAAAANDLVRPGEHFELPDFRIASPNTNKFAFKEGPDGITKWAGVKKRSGLVKLSSIMRETVQRVVPLSFADTKGHTLLDIDWGTYLKSGNVMTGGWVLLPEILVLSPWQAPTTWQELFDVSRQMGVDLISTLINVFGPLRDGHEHVQLIGFPIPETFGGSPFRIHWQALSLPRLSTFQEARQGFRPTNEGAMKRDLAFVLNQNIALKWLESENWDRRTWWSRGHLNADNNPNIVIIGLGAIGSAVAEMLARGGLDKITLIDGDDLEPGNLVRHTLTFNEEGKNKAIAVAERLSRISPHIRVEAIANDLNPQDPQCRKAIGEAELVIDCTASNEVIAELHTLDWKDTTTFVSLAIGINAERIYIYAAPGWSFSVNHFKQLVEPLIRQDYEAHPDFELPQQDAGCWHPLFPASSKDIWFMSSLAIGELENLVNARLSRAELRLIKYDGQLHREVLY